MLHEESAGSKAEKAQDFKLRHIVFGSGFPKESRRGFMVGNRRRRLPALDV
jgi:hypothetical protein